MYIDVHPNTAELPEVDMVMGFEHYGALPSTLRGMMGLEPEVDPVQYQQRARVQVGDATVAFRPEWDRHRLTPSHYAYLRVAEGCNHACTFCAIPGFRYVGLCLTVVPGVCSRVCALVTPMIVHHCCRWALHHARVALPGLRLPTWATAEEPHPTEAKKQETPSRRRPLPPSIRCCQSLPPWRSPLLLARLRSCRA